MQALFADAPAASSSRIVETTGTNMGASSAERVSRPARAALRQANRCRGVGGVRRPLIMSLQSGLIILCDGSLLSDRSSRGELSKKMRANSQPAKVQQPSRVPSDQP
jgi:hypothetical protein